MSTKLGQLMYISPRARAPQSKEVQGPAPQSQRPGFLLWGWRPYDRLGSNLDLGLATVWEVIWTWALRPFGK